MKNIAIIPARSGSKGLKDKNIKLLDGKPLIYYSIRSALDSKVFDEVFVSTDSEKYSDIAKECGANVPFLRDEELASDTSSTWDVVKDVLSKYKQMGKNFDMVTILQPTSPLRTSTDIINAYELFNQKEANSVVSVCEFEHSPLLGNELPNNLSLEGFLKKEYMGIPRQQLPVHYRLNGAIYMVKTDFLFETDNIYGKDSFAYVMDNLKSVDIDNELDFMFAELIYKKTKK